MLRNGERLDIPELKLFLLDQKNLQKILSWIDIVSGEVSLDLPKARNYFIN